MDSDRRTALVLGGYRQTLAVLRSLAGDYDLVLGRQEAHTFVDRSRHVVKTWQHPPLSPAGAERFFASLHQLLEDNPSIELLFPVGDTEILFLSEHREKLPSQIRCVMPDVEVVHACQQKTEMFDRVGNLGVPNAAYQSVTGGPAALLESACAVGFPCIVKPENETSRIFGKKAFIALTQESLQKKLDQFAGQDDAVPSESIVQKYCVGPRRNVYFFAQHGVVKAAVEVEIDRTDQWDGTGYAVEGHSVAPSQPWSSHLQALAKSLEYHGAGCLQYLIDPATGQATFLEINARLGANVACAVDCGLDLPAWWAKQVCDESISWESGDFRYPIGRRYSWLYGDLLGLKKAIGARQLAARSLLSWGLRMFAATLRSRTHITFQWNDPLPTAVVFAELFAGPFRRLFQPAVTPARQPSPAKAISAVRPRTKECGRP